MSGAGGNDTIADDLLRSGYDRLAAHIEDLFARVDQTRPYYQERMIQKASRSPFPLSPSSLGPRTARERHDGGVSVDTAAFLLQLAAKLCGTTRMSDFDDDGRRPVTAACRLLGLPWSETERAVSQARRAAPIEEVAQRWNHFMRGPDPRVLGFVYSARCAAVPGLVKVGFSTKPNKRMKSLARVTGLPCELIHAQPGTLLHEVALHDIIPGAVYPEWYPATAVQAG